MPRLSSALIPLVIVALALVAAPSPARAGVPREFVGLSSDDLLHGSGDYRSRTLASQASLGVGIVRQPFFWSQIEHSPGVYDLTTYDDLVARSATHGIEVLPILFDPPSFRSSRPAGGARGGTYPPRVVGHMGTFAAELVRRYGPAGSLWRERPGLPYRPVRSWQVWNEPNLPAYWPSGPSARQYTKLLAAVATAVRAVDPRAQIVTAGLPQSRSGIPLLRYVADLYRAGARPYFDTMAVNPYAGRSRDLLARLEGVRRLMDGNGDRRKRIWATEIGWADGGNPSPQRVGAKVMAERIRQSISLLARERRRLRLRGFVYYGWRDQRPLPPQRRDLWGLHTGLLRVDGAPKPAFFAFRRAVKRLRR